MITFVARQRCKDGADIIRAEWNGAEYEGRATHYGGSALGRAARELVETGCPDDEWQMVGPEGDRRLFGGSLHGLAKLTINRERRAVGPVRPVCAICRPHGRALDGLQVPRGPRTTRRGGRAV
jgi:hypothetical protein